MTTAVDLRVEHLDGARPTVGTDRPRLSWRVETDRPGWHQAGYEIEAGDERWTVDGRDTVLTPWPGAPLPARTAVTWRVRVWGEDGSESDWSEPHTFEVGLLGAGDWVALAVGPDWDEDLTASQPAALLRRSFTVDAIGAARLHMTALGIYEAELNGVKVGDHWLAPGWTAYRSRIHVQTHDVTPLLRTGENELVVTIADGWHRGNLGFVDNRNTYGDRLGVIAQLEIDGRVVLATDDSWEAATGPVRAADIYNGETHDARIEPGPWSPVRVLELDLDKLEPQLTPPVRATETLRPVARTGDVVDFGQNLVGVLRIRVRGVAGATVTLRHAEVLEDGQLCTRILRKAKATDHYTLRGDDEGETWSPRFTFHGFRYAEITTDGCELDDVEALVIHTDIRRTGWFECSEPLVNRLHENIVWGWRGNTVSVPTDCPQRDERLGWTGDLQVFAPTACFLYDTAGFLDGWLRDLAADQRANGIVPPVIPDCMARMGSLGAAGWADAVTVVPAVVHEFYGDEDVLARQLDSMRRWVDWVSQRAGDDRLWTGDFQFGDWVDPTVDPHTPGSARTDPGFVATAYFAHSCDLLARAARVVGEDPAPHEALAAEIRSAFRHEWVAPSGRVVADTQAGCALALAFDMVDPQHRAVVGARLRELVEREGHRLSTGFLGTPVLAPALTDAGHVDTAYQLLLQTKAPSWLYPVTVGATTIWERWDALQPDGSLNAGSEMLSFNHYALGAIGQWLHRTVGGLSAIEPGFSRFRVAPMPGEGINHASTVFDSRHGRIEVRWSREDDDFELHVTVPPNTDAEVELPDGEHHVVGSGTHAWTCTL